MKTTKEQRVGAFINRAWTAYGLSVVDTLTLVRAGRVLHRWAELECGTERGHVERCEGREWPVFIPAHGRQPLGWRYPDYEAGAIRRVNGIMARYPDLLWYHQTDCRGCQVYVLKRSDVRPGESVESVYTRGLAMVVG